MEKGGIRLSKKHGLNPSLLECPTCGGDMGLLMMGDLPGDAEAPRKQLNIYPCEKCMDKFKADNAVVLVGFIDTEHGKQPTGGMVVMKREAAKRMFVGVEIADEEMIFHCDDGLINQLIKMQKEVEKDAEVHSAN